ncbi:response regulator [Phenylobacterium sp.]|jgi:CheY-like chemotaxis protein|uniref:response regulator n=1 Tax=Phenylobacterium sp. TaxID=1871053 RepID=UPI002F9226A7
MGQLDRSGSPLRVLAVADHPTNRTVFEMILELAAARVVCVEDGAQAVDAYRTSKFDIILMDLQMPVNGVTATREIRRIEAEQGMPRTPLLVVTANTMSEQLLQAKAAGADCHMGKPITPETLLEAMDKAMDAAARAAA